MVGVVDAARAAVQQTHDPAHLHEAPSGVQEALKATEQAADHPPPPRAGKTRAAAGHERASLPRAYEAQQRATQALESSLQ